MERLSGLAVSPGVAIAEAVVLGAEELRIPQRVVAIKAVPEQVENLDAAIESSVKDLENERDSVRDRLGDDAADVLNWHIGVLRDPKFRIDIVELISDKSYSAPYATSTVMRKQQRRFMQMEDPRLAERMRDVQDIERRLLRNLLGTSAEDLAHLTSEVILVSHDLLTSQTATLSETKVAGVALDVGGPTSHTAILLRSWGQPAVIGVEGLTSHISGGDIVIVDGVNNLVIVNPDEPTLAEYHTKQQVFTRRTEKLDHLRDLPAVTQDDETINLLANIEYPREAVSCLKKGADGIGLYRTEFLFLKDTQPDEQEQYEAYRQAIQGADNRPVTIRTFDLGADKVTQNKAFEPERNPMLGVRSIRYSLRNIEMFKIQLRAILRASVHGDVQIMFPLISGLMELRQAKMALRDAMEDLEERGADFRKDIRVGMMMETPAAAGQARQFAREVEFVSIGTNDLVQYLLAADRGNEQVSRYYSAAHPTVLKTLRDIIRTCKRQGVACSLCGEMAGEPIYTMLLIGLGLRSFSMAPNSIPEIKKLIRLCTVTKAQRVARRALTYDTDQQVLNYLRSETRKLLPDDSIHD
jgi:phosphoenolpyruvate-protein phosphotransferase (PTS system enzyme I)